METLLHPKDLRQLEAAPPLQRARVLAVAARLEKDPFLGQQVRKARMPPLAPSLENLWRVPLPEGWRLLYMVVGFEKGATQAVLLWLGTHKAYDRLLGYRTS